MKRLLITGIMAGGLLLGGTATAIEQPGQWYVTPMASITWFDEDRLVDDDIGVALSVGRAVSENWNFEFHAFGYQLEGVNDTDYWGLGADVARVFYRSRRISPYLLAGGGWNKKNREFGEDDENGYLNAAFGFLTDIVPGGSAALRTELRYRLDYFQPSTMKDLMLNIGVQIPFGQPYASAAPVAAAPPPPPPAAAPPPPPPPPPPPALPPAPAAGTIISLEGVTFAFNSDALEADERGTLRDAIETLKRYPALRVEAAGHTDSVGSAAYNQTLSERRARSVVEYLAAAGIERDRLSARGYGETTPVADNASAAGRAQNRRVELRVLQ